MMQQTPTQPSNVCPGGGSCTCCRSGCDCGCRDDCPEWQRVLRQRNRRRNALLAEYYDRQLWQFVSVDEWLEKSCPV